MKKRPFDPFGDFDSAGYLQNIHSDKYFDKIKKIEHALFLSNLNPALKYLASRVELTYEEFLHVHRILFADYYPWAGSDRASIAPNIAINKGEVLFSHPQSARLAVEHGLRLGQCVNTMRSKPGEIMGLFAYGHPFLDGNGRVMLLVHMELAYRAGYSISWGETNKYDYLSALSNEIATPGKGVLDNYLLQLKTSCVNRSDWTDCILSMKGLDGLDDANQIDGDLSNQVISEKYRKFDENRKYNYTIFDGLRVDSAKPILPEPG